MDGRDIESYQRNFIIDYVWINREQFTRIIPSDDLIDSFRAKHPSLKILCCFNWQSKQIVGVIEVIKCSNYTLFKVKRGAEYIEICDPITNFYFSIMDTIYRNLIASERPMWLLFIKRANMLTGLLPEIIALIKSFGMNKYNF